MLKVSLERFIVSAGSGISVKEKRDSLLPLVQEFFSLQKSSFSFNLLINRMPGVLVNKRYKEISCFYVDHLHRIGILLRVHVNRTITRQKVD